MRYSNRVVEANRPAADSQAAELVKLRTEAKALRQKVDELRKQVAEHVQWRPAQAQSSASPSSSVASAVVSDATSEAYRIDLYKLACAAPHSLPLTNNLTMNDARNLSRALRLYAREHQGEIPADFGQAALYFETNREPPHASEFELVFQGSMQDLTNVPEQAVALIRERQPWPTPSGQWARVYIMAGLEEKVVESADNFQSWEADHLIPPLSGP